MSEFIELKTAELEGVALDWAAGKSAGLSLRSFGNPKYGVFIPDKKGFVDEIWVPSTSWAQCGPLITRFNIDLTIERNDLIYASVCDDSGMPVMPGDVNGAFGPTHLIAACRAIVAHKIGDTVSVPAELVS